MEHYPFDRKKMDAHTTAKDVWRGTYHMMRNYQRNWGHLGPWPLEPKFFRTAWRIVAQRKLVR